MFQMRNNLADLNKGLYIPSWRESQYLVHTTPYVVMKNILQDGFLTGDPTHIKNDMPHKSVLHPFQVCFSSLPERHLSAFPIMPIVMVSHNTYFKFPFKYLREFNVRPVIYKMHGRDMEHLNPWIHNRLVKKEIVEKEYGKDFKRYEYSPTWMSENEWRITDQVVPIPNFVEVWVANSRQRYELEKFTNLDIKIDPMMRNLTYYQNKRYKLYHWFESLLKSYGYMARHNEWIAHKYTFRLYDICPIDMFKRGEQDKLFEFENLGRRRYIAKVTFDILKKHFEDVSPYIGLDFKVDLRSRKKGSTCPNHRYQIKGEHIIARKEKQDKTRKNK